MKHEQFIHSFVARAGRSAQGQQCSDGEARRGSISIRTSHTRPEQVAPQRGSIATAKIEDRIERAISMSRITSAACELTPSYHSMSRRTEAGGAKHPRR